MSLVWGLLPVPFAALARRKTRRRTVHADPIVGDLAVTATTPSSDLTDFEDVRVPRGSIGSDHVHAALPGSSGEEVGVVRHADTALPGSSGEEVGS
jgi:hypothetical protein